eukprot:gene13066-9356_t
MSGDIAFFFLFVTIMGFAGYVLHNLYRNCQVSDAEVRQRMSDQEMIEMNELLADRRYLEEPGKILLPAGV